MFGVLNTLLGRFGVLLAALATLTFWQPVAAKEETGRDSTNYAPALWQLGDADTTIYLFGTFHFLPEDTHWIDERITIALSSSDTYVTEIDLSNTAAILAPMQEMGTAPSGSNLRDLMNEEDRAEYEAAIQQLGLAVDAWDQNKPWFAAFLLEIQALGQIGYSAANGVELSMRRYTSEMEQGALETPQDQFSAFNSLSQETQLSYLDSIVEALPTLREDMDELAQVWLTGEVETLGALMLDEDLDPSFGQNLLFNRNENWAKWISNRLDEPGTVFIAVGAGHLAGESSVQKMLIDRGIEVTRILQ